MKDTIGAHLAEAMRCASSSVLYANLMAQTDPETRPLRHMSLAWAVYYWEGAAAGHAFRAAELAYDLGQKQARAQCDECHEFNGNHKYWCGT